MVYMFSHALEPNGILCELDRNPLYTDWYKTMTVAEQLKPAEDWMLPDFPEVIEVDPRDGKLRDWVVGGGGLFFVSERVKALIEQLEPGLHQFLEVDLHYGEKTKPYFHLRFGRQERAFDLEKSDIDWTEATGGGKTIKVWHKKYTTPLVFPRANTLDKHLWVDSERFTLTFMSDELHDLFEREGVDGLTYEKQIIVA